MDSSLGQTLFMALELGQRTWKLAFSPGLGGKARQRTMAGGDVGHLAQEIVQARKRFGLPDEAPVLSCYEAGRDGFWVHRCLLEQGVANVVVDSSSIEVNRRRRRAKNDRLDAGRLLAMRIRHAAGERALWSVVNVPSVEDEDTRHLHRELSTLKSDRTRHINRIKGLLATCGLSVSSIDRLPQRLGELKLWDGSPVPGQLHQRLQREHERLELLNQHIRQLEQQRAALVRQGTAPALAMVRKLQRLRAIGPNGAWLTVMELFAWRRIRNRRQLGSLAGLAPTPFQSGGDDREQGISKAGNRRVRTMMVELAWCWLRFQPASELSLWFTRRFAQGSRRMRRIGIVALARKLLVQLWRYLETGTLPAGAMLKT
jgi:transposase